MNQKIEKNLPHISIHFSAVICSHCCVLGLCWGGVGAPSALKDGKTNY